MRRPAGPAAAAGTRGLPEHERRLCSHVLTRGAVHGVPTLMPGCAAGARARPPAARPWQICRLLARWAASHGFRVAACAVTALCAHRGRCLVRGRAVSATSTAHHHKARGSRSATRAAPGPADVQAPGRSDSSSSEQDYEEMVDMLQRMKTVAEDDSFHSALDEASTGPDDADAAGGPPGTPPRLPTHAPHGILATRAWHAAGWGAVGWHAG